jgi:two-component system sensor histidine kinase UhpB
LANDISNEAHYIPGPGRATRSELDVPLRVGERTIGVLNVESERLSAFASDDVPYLQGVAVLLAQAIENARLASRSRQLAAAEERSRLARDLHDDTVQALVAIDRQLDLLELDLADAEQTRRRIGAVQALVQRTMDGVRRLSRNLHPAVLEDLGLVPALQAHIQDLEASGLGVTITRKGRARRLPPAIEYAAYRVAQEALSNVLRHAGAPEADLQISFSPDDLELVVSDQGQGTGDMPPSLSRGQGIASMRDRAAEVGGVLEFESAPGKGTRVRLRVPLRLTMVARL